MLILRWLASQAFKGREILSILFVFGFCLWLSSRPEAVQKGWRKGFATTVFLPVHLVVENLHVRWGLEQELRKVREDNARLLAENAKLSEFAQIRTAMGEFEGIRPTLEFPFIGARVISRDPVRMGGIWILDEGAGKGIIEGMAVISSKGVVGRILASTSGYSQMQSLSDPDFRVAVMSVRSRHPAHASRGDSDRDSGRRRSRCPCNRGNRATALVRGDGQRAARGHPGRSRDALRRSGRGGRDLLGPRAAGQGLRARPQ